MRQGHGAADENVTPQPATDVRSIDFVGPDEVRAATAAWPAREPDRTVWRLLACASAGGEAISSERLRRVLPDCSLSEIEAARARVEAAIPLIVAGDAPLRERLAEPSITYAEALVLGLVDEGEPEPEAPCGSSI